ncbi:MAG: 4-alpha-glucanotransferase [Acidobacteria bacterium]|nr:4-alpha-glucanotransferase [Acidobacteriota bacterium]
MKFERACGVLLHPTSLPGPWGIGDLGPEAHRYVDWLAEAGVSWWQVLPLNPPGPGFSPYASISSFAGSALLVSPDALVADGLLLRADLAARPPLPDTAVAFEQVAPFKDALLRTAYARFTARPPNGLGAEFETFCAAQADWLDDFALFAALLDAHGGRHWRRWPKPLALAEPAALEAWRRDHDDTLRFQRFKQFLFDRQWAALRRHAAARGVRILGDLPIYVADNSADAWSRRELFQVDSEGRPTAVAGVPPDYFSKTGQLWGNPLYDWSAHERTGYAWWIARMRRTLTLVDAVRIDHFRGLAGYWAVPAGAKTAVKGRWLPGPGRALFDALAGALGSLPLVAEDLGVMTPDVEALRDGLGLPGMAVLQFAFSPALRSTFLPYRHRAELVVYTGTHDNNTTLGWYLGEATEGERDYLRRYLDADAREVHWDLIRAALASVADLAVVPHQDLAGLGGDCRMNTPSTAEGNWRFRLTGWMLDPGLQRRLADLVWLYGRSEATRPKPAAED